MLWFERVLADLGEHLGLALSPTPEGMCLLRIDGVEISLLFIPEKNQLHMCANLEGALCTSMADCLLLLHANAALEHMEGSFFAVDGQQHVLLFRVLEQASILTMHNVEALLEKQVHLVEVLKPQLEKVHAPASTAPLGERHFDSV